MLARSFLIESSSKLLVTRTGIKTRSSLILGRIRPLILELLALEWRKYHTFELAYLWSQLANLDQILCVALFGWGKGCIRFWPIMGKMMSPPFLGCFWKDHIWPWQIGLRWAIIALWATCFYYEIMTSWLLLLICVCTICQDPLYGLLALYKRILTLQLQRQLLHKTWVSRSLSDKSQLSFRTHH